MARRVRTDETGYFWRTQGDDKVRPAHQRMEGKWVRWDDPPTLQGLVVHAGTGPNCRCYGLTPDENREFLAGRLYAAIARRND